MKNIKSICAVFSIFVLFSFIGCADPMGLANNELLNDSFAEIPFVNDTRNINDDESDDGLTNDDEDTYDMIEIDYTGNKLSAGGSHSVVIQDDGSLWTWGRLSEGQLGTGKIASHIGYPVQIGSDTDWISVSAGSEHTIALKADGSLWAWGSNVLGQVGNGGQSNVSMATRIGMDNDWVTIAAGDFHNLAIKEDGSLWSWGYNEYGQLGDGTKTDRRTPVRIGLDNDWAVISPGFFHSLAIKTDGSLWAWGGNSRSQLGDGTEIDRNDPTQIGKDLDWSKISAGFVFSLAIKTDGSLWGWGDNQYSQLGGTGSAMKYYTPVRAGIDNDWATVTTGVGYSLALKDDGSLWGWGFWSFQSGGYDAVRILMHNKPYNIESNSRWLSVSTSSAHALAVKDDGSLWAWGWNGNGQLGDGTLTDSVDMQRIY